MSLNEQAAELCRIACQQSAELGITASWMDARCQLLDFGIEAPGSLAAGLMLARICLSDEGAVKTSVDETQPNGRIVVESQHPLTACMASQYAGWQIATDGFFGMCSGPIRAVYAREELFGHYKLSEESTSVVAVFETGKLPSPPTIEYLRQKLGGRVETIACCVAPTASIAGTVQITARSLETACHKLHELGFDLRNVRSGRGTAPLLLTDRKTPNADLVAMGACNDAILFGGSVELTVDCDDEQIERVGSQTPSSSSPQFGRPFAELMRQFGGDFYQLDPLLFARRRFDFTICAAEKIGISVNCDWTCFRAAADLPVGRSVPDRRTLANCRSVSP